MNMMEVNISQMKAMRATGKLHLQCIPRQNLIHHKCYCHTVMLQIVPKQWLPACSQSVPSNITTPVDVQLLTVCIIQRHGAQLCRQPGGVDSTVGNVTCPK
jgi:hypothetical protein